MSIFNTPKPLFVAPFLLSCLLASIASATDAVPSQADLAGSWWAQSSVVSTLSSEMRSFFAGKEGRYLVGNGPIDSQFESVMLAEHDKSIDFKNGDILISSHVGTDPTIRSALLIGPDGGIKAAGLIHHHCTVDVAAGYACASGAHPTLTIFVPRYSVDDRAQNVFVVDKVRAWASRSMRRAATNGTDKPVDLKIQVRELQPGT